MKKYFISIIILTLFILVIVTPQDTLADTTTDITSEQFLDEFNPVKPGGSDVGVVQELSSPITSAIVNIANPILGTLQIIRRTFSGSFSSNVWAKKYFWKRFRSGK